MEKMDFLFEGENAEQLARIIHNLAQNPNEILKIKQNIRPPPRIEEEALLYQNIYTSLLKPKIEQ